MDADQNKTVLVTGGRGFIGREVTKLLQRAGYAVISLDAAALPSKAAHDRESGQEIACDIRDADQLQRFFEEERISGIVHLAAILPTVAQREPLLATQINVGGSIHLLEMATKFGVRRLVFGSSLSVYGTWAADHVVSEADRASPEDVYGAAKLYVERVGETHRDRHSLEFVSLRIGRVVGAGAQSATSAWRSQIFELLGTDQAVEIAVPYVGTERILLVHVDDVAKMLVALLRAAHLEHAIYNAPCESMVVADLKRDVEALNRNIHVKLGEENVSGNPRLLDSDRFQREFGFQVSSIVERLKGAAK